MGVGSALFFDGVQTPVAESVRPFRMRPLAQVSEQFTGDQAVVR
ncbi:hypothetical protein ACSVHC_00310 [Arthrobacter sp. KNU-44]